jgi:hypothetical protein
VSITQEEFDDAVDALVHPIVKRLWSELSDGCPNQSQRRIRRAIMDTAEAVTDAVLGEVEELGPARKELLEAVKQSYLRALLMVG